MAKQKPTKQAGTVEGALDVVEALVELDGGDRSTVADHLGRSEEAVRECLETLERREYVVRDDGIYRVGMKFLEVGEHARTRRDLYRVSQSEVDKLAEQTDEHANLMVEEHGKGVFLYKAEGENSVQLDTHSGMRVHLQTTALGKAILAMLPKEEVEEILDRHGLPRVTEYTITDREELFDELAEIRERGYAFDDEERVHGMKCVAAPIVYDDVVGAVSVSSPSSHLTGDRFQEEIPELVTRAANVIEVNLRYD